MGWLRRVWLGDPVLGECGVGKRAGWEEAMGGYPLIYRGERVVYGEFSLEP